MDFLLSAPVVPFSLALGLLAGLLALELVALAMGASILAREGGEIDLPAAPEAPDLPDLPADLAQMDLAGVSAADLDMAGPPPVPEPTGLAAALGLGKVPVMIWAAAVLAGFGLSGYLLQSLAGRVLGAPLPVWLAVLPAAALGLGFARLYGRALARLIPRTETTVRSNAMLNGKRGVVSQGTARAGLAAEVRVTDAFGNLHFVRAEPLLTGAAIAQGTPVLLLHVRQGPARGQFRILALAE